MRSALGGKGINETRALQGSMGRRKKELKKRARRGKTVFCFGRRYGFPLGMLRK
jgi:hypothetical protein